MTPQRWERVKQIFQSAIECAPEERDKLLHLACADDPELRAEVESLIAAHTKPWDLLESPALESASSPENDSQLTEGQTIDHYRVLSTLGAGGMGEVYLAVDTRLGRKAALKLLPTRFTTDPDRLRRFILEAKAASALNHPNIITIYDIGRSQGTHYIGAEFIDGETLRERISRGQLATPAAVEIAIQIASALAAAHEAGITHRDIKPENVMLRRDGYVKVLDFGLAKLTPSISPDDDADAIEMDVETRSGAILGTMTYMSPEQARGLKVDSRTDIFSLGVVLYEMLTCRAPFLGKTPVDVLVSMLERDPQPLELVDPGIPVGLRRVVDRMLKKKVEERYGTCTELIRDLTQVHRELGSVEGRSMKPLSLEHGSRTAKMRWWINRRAGSVLAVAALLILVVLSLSYFLSKSERNAAIGSIAVLPFESAGSDAELELLSDGITESLINSLSQIAQLRVMARTTVFTYKGRRVDFRRVGNDLNVDAVLTGKVTQRGETLTVQADLVQVADGTQLWGDRYERSVGEVLMVQEGIARDITQRLRIKLTGAEKERVVRQGTDSVEAYHLYLKGRHHNNKRTRESFEKGLESFQKAIDLDPNYAQAYAGMADTYLVLGAFSLVRPRDVRPRAEAAARKALELDPDLVEALSASASLNMWSNNWDAVEKYGRRAIELNASYPGALYDYGIYLALMGRGDEAKRSFARAQQLDPLSATRSYGVARQLYWSRDYDAAISEFQQTLELDREYWPAHFFQAFCHMYKGRIKEAIAGGVDAVNLSGRHQTAVAALGMVYAAAGRRAESRKLLDELRTMSKQGYVSGYYFSQVHHALGENDQAFEWLGKLCDEGYGLLPYVRLDPNWDSLRHDPRYETLMRRIGLAP